MEDDALSRLIAGYKEFFKSYWSEEYDDYREKAKNRQRPQIMVIGCSDSRVNSAILTNAKLGEIFTVNNVANLVPPYKEGKDTHHSTSAAVEFAVKSLGVEHILILGHRNCGGIRALMEGSVEQETGEYSFIGPWVSIANEAKKRVLTKYPNASLDEQCSRCEEESLLVSRDNLYTFPWVKAGIANKTLAVHACYFDIATGRVHFYDDEKQRFTPIITKDRKPHV